MATVFGLTAPESACALRLETKFPGKVGRAPVLRCDKVSEKAMQEEIDESVTLRKVFRSLGAKEKSALGSKPWPLRGDLTFLGSDGKDIDPPKEVECSYYGPDQEADGDEVAKASAIHERAMEVLRFIHTAAIDAQKLIVTTGQEHATKGIAEVAKAQAEAAKAQAEGHKANAGALGEVAKQQTALVTLNEKLLAETQELKEANIGLLTAGPRGEKKAEKTLGEEIKEGVAAVEALKKLGDGFFGTSETTPEKKSEPTPPPGPGPGPAAEPTSTPGPGPAADKK